MPPVCHIYVPNGFQASGRMEVLSVLEELVRVKFICWDPRGPEAGIQGEGLRLGTKDMVVECEGRGSLEIPVGIGSNEGARSSAVAVKFADDRDVPIPFRGREVMTTVAGDWPFLSVGKKQKVLAAVQQKAIWTVREGDVVKRFRSSLPLPQMSEDTNFKDVFNGERWLDMLPLLYLLREVGGADGYLSPPLRAAYIIDDPNLHWPRYGFIDYREIAAHAERENYHVSFAMIPFDTWFTHGRTADLFRRNARLLSLVVHGNNHGKEELVRNASPSARKALLQQAVWRIERLERKTNLRVCRVMVPPHGACSVEMLSELPRWGFEGACISAGSLRAYNRDSSWTKTWGFFRRRSSKLAPCCRERP